MIKDYLYRWAELDLYLEVNWFYNNIYHFTFYSITLQATEKPPRPSIRSLVEPSPVAAVEYIHATPRFPDVLIEDERLPPPHQTAKALIDGLFEQPLVPGPKAPSER